MSERVQLNLEHQIAELRDLQEKKIFTSAEISEIVKRRTAYELSLVSRSCTPRDFLRYAEYEQKLEKLRKLRAGKKRSTGPPSISAYSIPRHVTNLLSMGTRRFRTSRELWSALISHVKSMSPASPKQISKVLTSAIAAQPHSAEYWLIAIKYTERHEDAAATRKLIMRSLRFVKRDWDIWEQWIRLEIGFADKLKKRWQVLGVNQKGKEKAAESLEEELVVTPTLDGHQDEEMDQMTAQVQVASVNDQDGVLNGQLVKLVLSNAMQVFGAKSDIFKRLVELLQFSKSPLKSNLLEYLYIQIAMTYAGTIEAEAMLAERYLSAAASTTEDKILAISQCVKAYWTACKRNPMLYTSFLAFMHGQLEGTDDEALKSYLSANCSKIYKAASKHQQVLQNPDFWLAYLECCTLCDLPTSEAAESMTKHCPRSEALRAQRCLLSSDRPSEEQAEILQQALSTCPFSERIWTLYLDFIEQEWLDSSSSSSSALESKYLQLLNRAQTLPPSLAPTSSFSTDSILDLVLGRYISYSLRSGTTVDYTELSKQCTPSLAFYHKRIQEETNLDSLNVLHRLATAQSAASLQDYLARLDFLVWQKKDVKEAQRVLAAVSAKLGLEQKEELAAGWTAIIDRQPEEAEGSENESDEEEMEVDLQVHD